MRLRFKKTYGYEQGAIKIVDDTGMEVQVLLQVGIDTPIINEESKEVVGHTTMWESIPIVENWEE